MQRNAKAFSAVFALAFTALSTAQAEGDRTRLIVLAGLTPEEAQQLSLTEVAILRFNRSVRQDDRISLGARNAPVPIDPDAHAQLIAASGLSREDAGDLTLTKAFVFKIDRDQTDDLRLQYSAGPVAVDAVSHAQLIAAAKLTPDEASGMTLSTVALNKYYQGSNDN